MALAFSIVLLALASLQFFSTQSILLWKITIACTEFGHWIVLLPLVFLFMSKRRAVRAALALTALLFLLPSARMLLGRSALQEELAGSFGNSHLPEESLSLSRLWTGSWKARKTVPKTIDFRKDANIRLGMDAYLPSQASQASQARVPWVLVLHGGGWSSGDREQLSDLNSVLAQLGIAAFEIDYRLSPQWHWPAQREDAKDAVQYIKAHAAELNIDPSRWAVLGRSAGGQIAEALAFQLHDPTLKGLVSFYAPSDMNFVYKWGREDDILESRQLVRDFMGGTPSQLPDLYNDASPIDFVTKDSPPVLMFHGPHDPMVWVENSRRLDAKLKSVGAQSLLVEIPWATHGFDFNLFGPGGQISTYSITFFLMRVFGL
jgi:acetyl esterase/lipase